MESAVLLVLKYGPAAGAAAWIALALAIRILDGAENRLKKRERARREREE